MLDRPENQWVVQRLNINPAVGQPALTPSLPAGSQAVPQRQMRFPAIETDGFAEQRPGHHPAEQHQMTTVSNGTVLTQKAGELTGEPGVGIQERLDWCDNPNISRFPARPIE